MLRSSTLRLRALQSVHIENGRRQPLEALRIVGADVEVAQLDLALGPGHREGARGRVGVAILVGQLQRLRRGYRRRQW